MILLHMKASRLMLASGLRGDHFEFGRRPFEDVHLVPVKELRERPTALLAEALPQYQS